MYRFTIMLVLFGYIQPAQAVDRGDILDFIPAIIAASQYEAPPPPPPPVMPAGVTLLATKTYQQDYSGDLLIVGEIYNNTSSYIRFTKITANVYNNGRFVATDYTYVSRDIMSPRTKSCFKMYTDYAGPYTGISFERPTYRTTSNRLANLTVSNVSRTSDYSGDIQILGIVKNNSSFTADFAKVIGTFYNSSSKAIDCDYTYANTSTLPPNQSSSFKIWTSTPSSSVNSFVLQTDS